MTEKLIETKSDKVKFLKDEYSFSEVAKMGIFGNRTTIWRKMQTTREKSGKPKPKNEILKYEDRRKPGMFRSKIVFLRKDLEKFLDDNYYNKK